MSTDYTEMDTPEFKKFEKDIKGKYPFVYKVSAQDPGFERYKILKVLPLIKKNEHIKNMYYISLGKYEHRRVDYKIPLIVEVKIENNILTFPYMLNLDFNIYFTDVYEHIADVYKKMKGEPDNKLKKTSPWYGPKFKRILHEIRKNRPEYFL